MISMQGSGQTSLTRKDRLLLNPLPRVCIKEGRNEYVSPTRKSIQSQGHLVCCINILIAR